MGGEESAALDLVVALCRSLEDEAIRYCHWKSNEAIDRSASGENDLDLLVDRRHADRFGAVLHTLGFKQARPTPSREVPGLIDHYGFDAPSGLLVHLQAHYQLVLGDDMTKNFHLPIEQAYLDSEGPEGLIRVPAPEFELAVFVVRMVLKHASWDAQLSLLGELSASEQRELAHLLAQVPEDGRAAALAGRLPMLSPELVRRCLEALQDPPSRAARAALARSLERELAPYARHPRGVDLPRRVVRRGLRAARHVAGPRARKRLVDGGAVVGVVGADPALVTSVSAGLVDWLGRAFVAELFAFGATAGSADLIHRRARRFAGGGGIAVCDRFPAGLPAPEVLVEIPSANGSRSADEVLREAQEQVWADL